MSSTLAELALLSRHFEEQRARLVAIVSRRMTPEARQRFDAEDVVQEVLHEASRKWPDQTVRRPSSPSPHVPTTRDAANPEPLTVPFAWLYRLTIDRLTDHLRTIHRAARDVQRDVPLPDASALCIGAAFAISSPGPATQLQQAEQSNTIREALASLKDRDRDVIWMRVVDQLTFGEIAATLEITENTATVTFARALRRLRDACKRLIDDFESASD